MTQALLNSLWQGALIFLIAAGLLTFVPQRHAATRHTVWFVALVALVLLPLSGVFSLAEPSSAIPSAVIRTTTAVKHLASDAASADGWWLAALWLAGVALCAVRLALSYVRIAGIMRSAVRAPGLGENVFTSTAITVPVAAGFLRPIIILPDGMARELDSADIGSIVAHERAHIRRGDTLGNLIQRLVESLFFFNPWVYVIGHQLVKEREAACDDWAVLSMSDPNRYASCLANLARRKPRHPSPLLTPSAIGSGRMLVGRIARLLNGKAGQVKTNYLVVAVAVTVFAVLGFALQTSSGLASTGSAVAANDTKCSADVVVLQPVPPDIPEAVAKAHPNAQAIVLVTVAANGKASAAKIEHSSGNSAIDGAAQRAALRSTYKPELRNCKAVSGGQFLFHIQVSP